ALPDRSEKIRRARAPCPCNPPPPFHPASSRTTGSTMARDNRALPSYPAPQQTKIVLKTCFPHWHGITCKSLANKILLRIELKARSLLPSSPPPSTSASLPRHAGERRVRYKLRS